MTKNETVDMTLNDKEIPIHALLVEDSPSIALNVQVVFSSFTEMKLCFHHVTSLKAALARLEERNVTVVILDLGLPDSQGLDTFLTVHERFPDLPVVVFSGNDDRATGLEAIRFGAQDYLVKGNASNDDLIKSITYAIERKQADLELRMSREQYRTLLEALPDIAFRLDEKGCITFINQAVRVLGYTPKELIGAHFSTIIHPDDIHNVSRDVVLSHYEGKKTGSRNAPKLFDERRTGERMTRDLSVRLVPSGWKSDNPDIRIRIGTLISYGEVSATGHYLQDSRSSEFQFAGTVGIIKDNSERKYAEDEKSRIEAQLIQFQKMEAIGRLASGMAHDMNNVLGAIKTAASLLHMAKKDDSLEDVNTILMACEKGQGLIQGLLGFARQGKYVRKNIQMNDVITDVVSILKRTTVKNIDIQVTFDPRLGFVEGDGSQIHHALMNICLNSVDAIEDNGWIHISTRRMSAEELRDPLLKEVGEENCIEILVEDNGSGISPSTIPKVFEPFFTTKEPGQGTGIGLSLVYGVIHNHGGVVGIESELKVGTRVRIVLPMSTNPNPISIVPESTIPDDSISRDLEEILVVDDEQLIRTALRRLLERLGYCVYCAESGEVALEIYRKHGERIKLVLLDMIMPGMDGLVTCLHLKQINPNVQVVLLSGYAKDHKVETLLNNGVAEFIQKPFEVAHLANTIRRVIRKS